MNKYDKMKRFIGCSIICMLLIGISCQKYLSTPIGKILSEPREYEGKEVIIKGKVSEVHSLIFVKYFKVKDKTGEIIVITEKTLPKINQNIKIKGTVEPFQILSETFIVIKEKSDKE